MGKVNFLLPMKGHSERVPNKNLRTFVEFPLYHYVLRELLKSNYLENVYIDTDSENIIADVQNHFPDVKIIHRPESLQGDFVSMNRIIEHDISCIKGHFYLQTHSTNPLLNVKSIDTAIKTYFELIDDYDSLFSVTRRQTRYYWQDGTPVNHDPDVLIRTQDLPPVFEENSNFYLFSDNSFRASKNRRIGLKPYMFEISPVEAIDIDTEFDFKLAEYIYKLTR